jgi:16S rRNA (cytidine1402-2'-O)-methyltransferase
VSAARGGEGSGTAQSGAATSGAAQSGAAQSGAAPRPVPPAGAGRLFVVATPIGNLGDLTFRALEILKSVPLVAAEDTRHTLRLFGRYEITTHLVSYHARSGRGRELELLEHLRTGRDLALVTDAGTPLVSDPGAELASAWAAEGGAVVPIPGASAVLAALVSSGLPAARWTFEGFLPRSGRERRERLARIAADERACVIYEAPTRIRATLADLAGAVEAAGCAERRAAVCRELTKIHEEVVRGTLGALAARAAAGEIAARGEFAVVIEALTAGSAASGAGEASPNDLESARAEVARLTASGLKRSEAVRQVTAATGLDRRELYREA